MSGLSRKERRLVHLGWRIDQIERALAPLWQELRALLNTQDDPHELPPALAGIGEE